MDQERQKPFQVLSSCELEDTRDRVDIWWLRSPGNNDNNAAVVKGDGNVNNNGNNVNNKYGVRPAWPYRQISVLRRTDPCRSVTICLHKAKESYSVLRIYVLCAGKHMSPEKADADGTLKSGRMFSFS